MKSWEVRLKRGSDGRAVLWVVLHASSFLAALRCPAPRAFDVLGCSWTQARPRIRGCPSSMGLGSEPGGSPGSMVQGFLGFLWSPLAAQMLSGPARSPGLAALLPALAPSPLFPAAGFCITSSCPRNLGSFPELSPPSPCVLCHSLEARQRRLPNGPFHQIKRCFPFAPLRFHLCPAAGAGEPWGDASGALTPPACCRSLAVP